MLLEQKARNAVTVEAAAAVLQKYCSSAIPVVSSATFGEALAVAAYKKISSTHLVVESSW